MEQEKRNSDLLNNITSRILFQTYIDWKLLHNNSSILISYTFNPRDIYINCHVGEDNFIYYTDNFLNRYIHFSDIDSLVSRIEFWLSRIDKYEDMIDFFRYNLTEKFIKIFNVDYRIEDNMILFFHKDDIICFSNESIMDASMEELDRMKKVFLSWITDIIVSS